MFRLELGLGCSSPGGAASFAAGSIGSTSGSFAELLYGFTHRPCESRESCCSKQQQYNNQDDEQLWHAEPSEEPHLIPLVRKCVRVSIDC